MNKKIVVVFVVGLFLLVTGNVSFAQTNEKTNQKIEIELIPSDIPISAQGLTGNPIVVITEPQNGEIVYSSYLEVLGYATDFVGLDYMQWKWEWAYGSYTNSSNLTISTHYNFRVRLYNIPQGWNKVTVTFCNIEDNCSYDSVTITYVQNNPPSNPGISGPSSGNVGQSYEFFSMSTDSNGDKIKYGWDWDANNVVDEWTSFYKSGQSVGRSHIWSLTGTYNIKVMAEDEKGAQSSFSLPLTIVIGANHAPNQPAKPSGPINGASGRSYSYSTYTTDSDGDKLYYMFDWADGTDSGWVGPYNSGDTVSASHIWNSQGSFSIKVKAKDEHGVESTWSESLPITMPKSKIYTVNLFEKMPMLKQIFSLFFKK
jgi:hypothetical protein